MTAKRYRLLVDAGGVQVAEKAIEVVVASDYDTLEARLTAAHDTLDYFGHSPPYDGSQAKAHKARIRELEAALHEIQNGNPRKVVSSPNGSNDQFVDGMYTMWKTHSRIAASALGTSAQRASES